MPTADLLTAALAHHDAYDFLSALAAIDPRYNGIAFRERPEPLRTFGCAYGLHAAADSDGIWKFLAQREGDGFAETIDACRRLGAARAVEYLEAAARLFPGGRVPPDHHARNKVLERLEREATDKGKRDALAAIDTQFAGALDELAERVRARVVANRKRLAATLAALPGPAKPQPSLADMMTTALGQLQAAVARKQARDSAAIEALKAAAKAHGTRPWKQVAVDERYFAFVRAATRLTKAQWRTVALRKLEFPRKVDMASELASETKRLVVASGMVAKGKFEAAWDAAIQERKKAFKGVEQLLMQARHQGKPVGLRVAAHKALVAATLVLLMHEWMMVTPEGVAAARAAYYPFDGLAPLPELPPVATSGRSKPASKPAKKSAAKRPAMRTAKRAMKRAAKPSAKRPPKRPAKDSRRKRT